MQARAMQVRQRFGEFELSTYGEEWSTEDLMMELMTDVGDLAFVVQRFKGKRAAGDGDPQHELRHELSDVL
jgi:hypothetical protein